MSTSKLVQYGGILGASMLSTYLFASLTPKEPLGFSSRKNLDENGNDSTNTTISNNNTSSNSTLSDNNTAPSSLLPSLRDQLLSKINTESSLLNQLSNASDEAIELAFKISKYGLPSFENLRFHDSYVSSISYQNKQPNWVCEYLTVNDINDVDDVHRKHSTFKSDESVPLLFRSDNDDYRRSGLSRGHLAASGNHNDIQSKKDCTFILSSNIVPQDLSMNGCDWYRLENFVRNIVKSEKFDDIWVISGPVFKPKKLNEIYSNGYNTMINTRVIGGKKQNYNSKTQIPVASHLFKIILCEKKIDGKTSDENNENSDNNNNSESSRFEYAAFLMPNVSTKEIKPVPITDYQVDMNEIEKWTGLQFFPKLFHQNENGNEIISGNENNNNFSFSTSNVALSETNEKENNNENENENDKEAWTMIDKMNNIFDLCKNYGCNEPENGRSEGWRHVGLLKTATDFDTLDMAFERVIADNKKEELDFLVRMNTNTYRRRKKELIKEYEQQIEYYKQFLQKDN